MPEIHLNSSQINAKYIHKARTMTGFLKKKNSNTMKVFDGVADGMKEIYKKKLLPLERDAKFHEIQSPMLEEPDFDGKPIVMLIGQYSTGKTTFIRYLLERDFPGMRIGPEPTTDNFHVIEYAEEDGKIPGNFLSVDSSKPFRHLQQFGSTFLNRFEASQSNSEALKSVTLLDTPGILSGEKQVVNRGYDFAGVLKWFAERADKIILLFDAHKLDISDEFKQAIQAIRKNENKIRIVLNKADMMTHQQLMRVYGALMWSLARILQNPEVCRIYVGSFWNQPLQYTGNRELFEMEEEDLFDELQKLPRFAMIRRLNDLIKRAKAVKVHHVIVSHLKAQMPVIGKDSKKKDLIKNLGNVFKFIQEEHDIPAADFPDAEAFAEKLKKQDFTKFPAYDKAVSERIDKMLEEDLPKLMKLIPTEESDINKKGQGIIKGGIFNKVQIPAGKGIHAGMGEKVWIVSRNKIRYDEIFSSLEQHNGKVTGRVAKEEMLKSKLPNNVLGKVWRLADVDGDGMLDHEEFALAMHLIQVKCDGFNLPDLLPDHLIPPGHRAPGNGHNNGHNNSNTIKEEINGN